MTKIGKIAALLLALNSNLAVAQSAEPLPAGQQSSAAADESGFQVFEHGERGGEEQSAASETSPARSTVPPYSRSVAQPERTGFRESIYVQTVSDAEIRYGLPPGLLRALIWTESRYNPMAVSPAGAAGLAQLMPATARYLGVANRHDPGASIDGGARYLREMLDKFGAIHLALAAYNAGPGAVARAKGIPSNGETPGYVRSVLARWKMIGG